MDGQTAEAGLRRQESNIEKRPTGVPAFKEWAIVCASIERGETSLIFRKGGIAEGSKGFQFKYRQFFLFPTYFHEQIERTRLSGDYNLAPRKDCVAISVLAEVEFALVVRDLSAIHELKQLHVLQSTVLEERFRYDKQAGLHVAFLRAFRISPVWELPFHPSYGGCRSWITLPDPPSHLRKETVLSDEEQTLRRSLCLARLPSIVE